MINKLIKYLSSLRFTILLICLLGVMFAIGLCVPQVRLVKDLYLEWRQNSPNLVAFLDALGLTRIYTSPITITLWGGFFLNLTLVLWQRIPLIRKRISLTPSKIVDPVTGGGFPYRQSYALPSGLGDDQILATLGKRGYTLVGDGKGFYAVKNRYAPVAFALFHLSFFLVLLGGLISVYTQFAGYLDLGEGESFQGELNRYNAAPRPKLPEIGTPPVADFTVQSIVPHVVKNTPTGIDVKIVDSENRSHLAGINTPYVTGPTSFVFKHLGMAPLMVLKDPSGREVGSGYIKLDVLLGHRDQFSMGDYVFTASFYPDYGVINGKPATLTQEFKNPVFNIVVQHKSKAGVAGKEVLATGLMPRNGVLSFDGGYRLEMQDQRYWVRFYVIKEHGLLPLYIGFALATCGVIWRMLFFRREIVGAVREQDGARSLLVAARSEYYKSLAEDEFNKLFAGVVGATADTN